VQSHRNLLTGCDTVYSYLGYRDDDRIVCLIPWGFDYGYGQLLSTLCRGLTHILLAAANPFAVCEATAAHHASIFPGVPSVFTYLFRGVSPIRMTNLESVRLVTNTGGTIPGGVLDDMIGAFERAKIVLNYGLTESYRSTYLPPSLLKTHRNSIGRPIPGVDIAIVGEDGRIAAPGEIGEIVHRGNGIFLGYWGNAEATGKALRSDPLLPKEAPDSKALYTGDLGYRDDEGFIYFKGRRDQQLKSMGVRVSPGEVEAILQETSLLRGVAVFGLPHELIGDAVMCAYEAMPGGTDIAATLQKHARITMSAYMQPREYFPFESLPKTPNGKIDYVAIRQICREKSVFTRQA
jgi:acyl-coenzyme A synthetase/AMP-(fatty) acid ligase